MTTPQVSLLIPVYNRERLVGACIESALAQGGAEIEVVVTDNCSTDGTFAECQRWAARDARVRALRNDANLGPVGNWRRAAELARAPFAKLLFSDDRLDPAFTRTLLPYLQDPEVGLAWSGVRQFDDAGRLGRKVLYALPGTPAVLPRDAFLHAAMDGKSVPLSPGAALFRTADLLRNLVDTVPSAHVGDFARTGAGPDLLTYLLTAKDYPKVAHAEAPLALFHAHEGSLSGRNAALIRDQYAQARVWFAEAHGDAALRRAAIRGSLLADGAEPFHPGTWSGTVARYARAPCPPRPADWPAILLARWRRLRAPLSRWRRAARERRRARLEKP